MWQRPAATSIACCFSGPAGAYRVCHSVLLQVDMVVAPPSPHTVEKFLEAAKITEEGAAPAPIIVALKAFHLAEEAKRVGPTKALLSAISIYLQANDKEGSTEEAAKPIVAAAKELGMQAATVLEYDSKLLMDACVAPSCIYVHYAWWGNPSTEALIESATKQPNIMATEAIKDDTRIRIVYWRAKGPFTPLLDPSIIERQLDTDVTPVAEDSRAFPTFGGMVASGQCNFDKSTAMTSKRNTANYLVRALEHYRLFVMVKDFTSLLVLCNYGGVFLDTTTGSFAPDRVTLADHIYMAGQQVCTSCVTGPLQCAHISGSLPCDLLWS